MRKLFLALIFFSLNSYASTDFFYIVANECSIEKVSFESSIKTDLKKTTGLTLICFVNDLGRPECKMIDNVTKKEVKQEFVKTLTMGDVTVMKPKEANIDHKIVINMGKKMAHFVSHEILKTNEFELKSCTGKIYTEKDVKDLDKKGKNKITVLPED